MKQRAVSLRIGLAACAIASVAVLGGFAAGDGQAAGSSKSAGAGLIAYGVGGEGIFVVRADGSSPAVNVSGGQDGSGPTWAPDGRRLAYLGPNGIWVVDADGTSRRQLAPSCPSTTCTTFDGPPVWSPDGSKIAWLNVPATGLVALEVVSADGSHLRTIAHICQGHDEGGNRPSWSPDGKWLVVGTGCAPWIRIVRVSDGRQRTLISDGPSYQPVWSPDGKTIAFDQYDTARGTLWTVRPDGKSLHELKAAGRDVWVPTWSPDSTRIAYSSSAGEQVLSADGTGVPTVIGTGGGGAWSPNSKRLAVVGPLGQGQALYTVAADGGALHRIATGNLDAEYSPPVWAP